MASKMRRKGPNRGPKKVKRGGGAEAKRQKQLRLQQGGTLPRRPDIKGLDGDTHTKSKPKPSSKLNNSKSKPNASKGRPNPSSRPLDSGGKRREETKKPRGPLKKEGPSAGGEPAGGPSEAPRKRKLANGQERLRALLKKHPDLLQAGESADVAVAACFKKAALSSGEEGPGAAVASEAGAAAGQQQQLSGSKRRKLLRLVMSGKTAEEKVFVHQTYQLYNEILRSIRASAGAGEGSSKLALKTRVAKAVSFLEEPINKKDRHACTARLAQICLKHSEGDLRSKLWQMLFTDFVEFCCCKAFHHVAMKMFLYATEAQKKQLEDKLLSRRDVALTKHGAIVWEYIYSSQKTSVAQQRLVNFLLLDSSVPVAVPKVNDCHSFAQVVALLSETQRSQVLENTGNLIQKFVDKELLGKAHVHRIIKGLCSVASPEQLKATWQTVAEGALHLATTKDGVEALVPLLGYASAKDRKGVVKALKQHCVAFATNPVDCPLLLRLLLTIDDTKLTTDHIIKELMPAALQLAFDPYGHFLLLQLLHTEGLCKQLPAHYQELLALPSPTSLKAAAVRQSELRAPVLAAVSAAIAGLPEEAVDEEQKSICGALKDGVASKVLVQLAHHREADAAMMQVVATVKSDLQSKSPSLITHPVAQRTLSALVKAAGSAVLRAMWAAVASNLTAVLETKGVFVALQIFKAALDLKETELETEMRKLLDRKRLQSAQAAVTKAGTPDTGIQILIKELHG